MGCNWGLAWDYRWEGPGGEDDVATRESTKNYALRKSLAASVHPRAFPASVFLAACFVTMARLQLSFLTALLVLLTSSLTAAKSLRSRQFAAELQAQNPPKKELSKRASNTSDFRFYSNDTARMHKPPLSSCAVCFGLTR